MNRESRKWINNFNINIKLSRQIRRSQAYESRILLVLSDEVPESTRADIQNTEDIELMILSLREDIIDLAMDVCYGRYMERQKFAFTAHCAAEAWLQIIDWHYFRHDPGEDPSAHPPADIPNRKESWIPDDLPDPSPKDTWCKHDLEVADKQEEICCCSSLEITVDRIRDTGCDEDQDSCLHDVTNISPYDCSEKTKDSTAMASTSRSSGLPDTIEMDSSPHVPVSSECGGDSSRGSRSSKPRRQNIFSGTLGRSKQTLPPLEKSRRERQD